MTLIARRTVVTTLGLALAGLLPRRAALAAAAEEQDMVLRARFVVEELRNDPNLSGGINDLLKRCRGVLVFPNLIRAAFLFGGEGGVGVLLARGTDGGWSAPAFYGMGSGSFGFQAGIQTAEVMFIVMSDGALNKIMTNDVKLGGDLSVALGPIGAGLQANTTTNLRADIIAYAKTAGLYGGVSIEGSVISARESRNLAYYGTGASARAIIVDRRFSNPGADPLRAALADRR